MNAQQRREDGPEDEVDAARLELDRRRVFRRNLRAAIASVIPGLGHASLGYHLSGAIIASLFLVAINGAFLGMVLQSMPELVTQLRAAAPGLALAIWIVSIADSWRISFGRDRARLTRRRRELLQRGLRAYLCDRFDDARRNLRRAIRYDYDWEDPVLYFHLAVVEIRSAEMLAARGEERAAHRSRRAAQRAFARYAERDQRSRWRAEVESECARAGIPPPRFYDSSR
jgi:hypothetical protein